MAITLRRKQVDLSGYHLTDMAALGEAFAALSAEGWRGGIFAEESGAFRLELNADNPTRQIVAGIGDWLVDDMGWRLVDPDSCAQNYNTVEA